jgi:hypothetical protein
VSIFESIAIVAGDDETDEVYVTVRRFINGQWVRFIERFKTRLFDPTTLYDAWFVDAGGGGIAGYQAASTEEVDGAGQWTAHYIANNSAVHVLTPTFVESSNFATAGSAAVDLNGNNSEIAAGSNSFVYRRQSDGTVDTTYYVPSVGAVKNIIRGVKYTNDGLYLYTNHSYVVANDATVVTKFEVATGNELWTNEVAGATYGIDVDDNDNAYVPKFPFLGARQVLSDGTDGTAYTYNGLALIHDIAVDDTLDILVTVGRTQEQNLPLDVWKVIAWRMSTGAFLWERKQAAADISGQLVSVQIYNGFIYTCGDRGALEPAATPLYSVYKLDPTDGTTVAQYDTGADTTGIWFDNVYNVIVKGDNTDNKIFQLSNSDLSLIANYDFTNTALGGVVRYEGVMLPQGVGTTTSTTAEVFYPPQSGDYCQLEGEIVNILADGIKYPQQTVTNCSIDNTEFPNAVNLIVGLPVRYKLQPMEVNIEDYGFLLDKNITHLLVDFFQTLDGKYGPDMSNLDQIVYYRPTYNAGPNLLTGTKRLPFKGQYHDKGNLLFWGDHPLPTTVLGIGVKTGASG